MLASIFGMAGEALSADERAFFKDADPAGYILFARNCVRPDQMRALTDDLRAIHGRDDVPILIDQEGGRVARMKPPVWPAFPPGDAFARLYATAPISAMEALRVNCAAIASVLRDVGVNVDCLPLLDVRQPGAHDIIGDRALGNDPMQVASLGRATIDGLRESGVVGVVKHMPGHGRSISDSHVELPVVSASAEELETDIRPFQALKWAPMGMTAHVVYTAWDSENCGSQSAYVIGEIIRKRIGFEGWLMSDDLGMHALQGDFGDRAARVLGAGCDVALHCSGDMAEMQAIAGAIGAMTAESEARLARAMATIAGAAPADSYADLAAKRDALLAYS